MELLNCLLKRCDTRVDQGPDNKVVYFKAHDSAGIDISFSN